jgi:hypothetical protein
MIMSVRVKALIRFPIENLWIMPLDGFQTWCRLNNVAQNGPFVVVSSSGALARGAYLQTLSITIMDATGTRRTRFGTLSGDG